MEGGVWGVYLAAQYDTSLVFIANVDLHKFGPPQNCPPNNLR